MKNLENRQSAMRERKLKPRRVAPPITKGERDFSTVKLRRRVSAFVLLSHGWSLSRVAAHLKLKYDQLVEWEELGCPLNF